MTAVMQPAPVTTSEIEFLDETAAFETALEEFLRDPISYGTYDFADPVSLCEFSTARHVHGTFAASLT